MGTGPDLIAVTGYPPLSSNHMLDWHLFRPETVCSNASTYGFWRELRVGNDP